MTTVVVDRQTGERVEEYVPAWLAVGIRAMTLVPRSVAGVANSAATRYCGAEYNDPAKGRTLIKNFVERYGIDVREAEKPLREYRTLNAFFQRRLKPGSRPVSSSALIVPADCRLTAYRSVAQGRRFWVKGDEFTASRLLGHRSPYHSPAVVFCRLAPQDYHRFHVPASGVLSERTDIEGDLYSVNPGVVASATVNVLTRNRRAYWTLRTHSLGTITIVAIGAACTGSIETIAPPGKVRKGVELGMFGFGGSTVVLLLDASKVALDADLLETSRTGTETLVRVGQSLGRCARL